MKFDLLYKHYEKLILAIVLSLFIFSLFWLIGIFNYVTRTELSSIAVIANKVAYEPVDKDSYNTLANLKNGKLWLNSEKRNISPNDPDYILTFTDFMIPFKAARSNAPKAKNKLIPYIYYKHGKCPISKENIDLSQKAVIKQVEIPDSESEDGLLINRLVLVKITTTKIPFILKKIIIRGTNKKNWDIQANVKLAKRGWSTKFLKIGDSVKINGIKYTIADIQHKTIDSLDPRLGVIVESDISSVILHNNLNEKLTAQKNQQIIDPSRKITLKDLSTGKIILAEVGDTITLRKGSGAEEYKIVDITNNNNSVECKRNEEVFVVDKKSNYKPPEKST
jgi:hypothetical protein